VRARIFERIGLSGEAARLRTSNLSSTTPSFDVRKVAPRKQPQSRDAGLFLSTPPHVIGHAAHRRRALAATRM